MPGTEELAALLTGGARVIVVSERDLDLTQAPADNQAFLLKMAEGSLAAGGRGGGFGERRLVRVLRFRKSSGTWEKLFDSEEEGVVARFEVPYYVARVPMTMADGSEVVGYGVVDPQLVEEFATRLP